MAPPVSPADLEVWAQARIALDGLVPYAAPITSRLIPVPVKGIGQSISCDANFRVYFDPAYARTVGVNVFAADLLHEALHLLSDHPTRAVEAGITQDSHARWNIAADESINGTVFALAAQSSLSPGGQRFRGPVDHEAIEDSGWVHPSMMGHPDGLLAEEYYERLKQQSEGDPKGGASDPQCGSCSGSGDDDAVKQAAAGQHGELPKGPSAEEAQSLRLEVAAMVEAHVQAHGRGSVPSGLLRTVDQLRRPPKVDWRRRLATLLRASLGSARGSSDFSYRRPRWREGIATPRLVAPGGVVAIVADTSGSMEKADLARVMDETLGILRAGGIEHLWWIATDGAASKPVKIADLRRAHLYGGGGTDMGAGLEAASTVRPRPHLTVVITDGDTDWPGAPPPCGRVVIVRTRRTRLPTPTWAAAVVDALAEE